MNCVLYITRGDHWSFESRERNPITEAEWLAYVAGDPEFRPAGPFPLVDGKTGEVGFYVELEGHWEWTAYPRAGEKLPSPLHNVPGGLKATFQYLRGGLIVRRPDADILRKALAVAVALGARVIGDDDKVY